MPESRGRGLVFRDEKQPPEIGPDTVAVYQVDAPMRWKTSPPKLRGGESAARGRLSWWHRSVRASNSPWHGDRCYVDLMYPGVTEKFLEVTLDAYKKNIGDQFGKRVLGAFTDEPNVRPAGGLALDRPSSRRIPEAVGLRPAGSLAQPDSARRQLEAGPTRLLSRWSWISLSSTGPNPTTTGAKRTALRSPGTTGTTSGPTASA